MKKEKKYFVLLADLVGSQLMEDRESATRRLKKTLQEFNVTFRDALFSPMEITRGDEVAAVMMRVDRLHDMMSAFTQGMRPIECRIVVTYGTLTAGLQGKRSTEIDGPAFYRADEEMKMLKEKGGWFKLSTDQPIMDDAISALMNLLLLQKQRMTGFQLDVVRLYAQGSTQAAIAKKLHRTQQQISQVIRVVRFDILMNAEKATRQLMFDCQRRLGGGYSNA